MNADELSYQRGTGVSWFGLGLQILFGATLLVYGIVGEDPAARSAGFAIAFGILLWGAITLVFNQHNRERRESLENEAYRQSSLAEASVFQETARGELIEADRLAWMHRWLLPSVSLVLAAAYITFGAIQLNSSRHIPMPVDWSAPTQSGWGAAISLAVAALGFVAARYFAGMAKQKVWMLLHGGAGAAVGAALLGAMLALAHLLSIGLDNGWLLRHSQLIVDVFMVLIGIEMVLNFVLTAYRPRKSGEYMRPAFDSRLLAFAAAPDRLAQSISDAVNYQFGFDVSDTWFYRLLSRSSVMLAAVGVLIAWVLSSFVIVRPDEQAIILKNGAFNEEAGVVGSGLHMNLPWPFGQAITFPADAVRPLGHRNDINAAAISNKPILWTDESQAGDDFFVVRASNATPTGNRAEDFASDLALVIADVPIHFVVTDFASYHSLAQDAPPAPDPAATGGGLLNDPDRFRKQVLRSVAEREIMQMLSGAALEQLLGGDRKGISQSITAGLQASFDKLNAGQGAGVQVVFSGVVGARPKADVAKVYEQVVTADQEAERVVTEAQTTAIETLASVAGSERKAREIVVLIGELNELTDQGASDATLAAKRNEIMQLIIEAGGEAAIRLAQARSERWQSHLAARTRAVRSQGQFAAYNAAPGPYRMEAYLGALRSAAEDARIWISPHQYQVRWIGTEQNVDISTLTEDSFGPAE